MKILRSKEGVRGINQKCNRFTADIITYGALTLESICEEYGVVPKLNKTSFLEDIVSSVYHKTNLEYACLGKKIDVKEACDLAIAVKHFVTFETFYFDYNTEEEIQSIKKFFDNREIIKNNYFYEKNDENENEYGIKKYQVSALIKLEQDLRNIKENALSNDEITSDEEILFDDEYQEIRLQYYCDLVMNSIDNAQFYPKNPIRNNYLNTIRDFYNKDSRVLNRLIINMIKHIYVKKEIKQENDIYYNDKNFNTLEDVLVEYIYTYMKC